VKLPESKFKLIFFITNKIVVFIIFIDDNEGLRLAAMAGPTGLNHRCNKQWMAQGVIG